MRINVKNKIVEIIICDLPTCDFHNLSENFDEITKITIRSTADNNIESILTINVGWRYHVLIPKLISFISFMKNLLTLLQRFYDLHANSKI